MEIDNDNILFLYLGLLGYLLFINLNKNPEMFSKNLLFEMMAVGIIFVIIGTITKTLTTKILDLQTNEQCKHWNKFYAMEFSLFLTGVIAHLTIEMLGMNHWYLKNGNSTKYQYIDNILTNLFK